MVTEGRYSCHRHEIYAYPRLDIPMCDREALEPAERVFRTKITAKRTKVIRCRPEDFPPDGKGTWRIGVAGGHLEAVVQRLQPLLTKRNLEKYQRVKETCTPKVPIRRKRRKYSTS